MKKYLLKKYKVKYIGGKRTQHYNPVIKKNGLNILKHTYQLLQNNY